MSIKSFDELLNIASKKETDLEKLKVLQQYFIENVSYYYPEDIVQDITLSPENYKNFKNTFDSEEDKNHEINEFEKRYGETFHFSKDIRSKIVNLLGIVTNPTSKKISIGTVSIPGYDGSIVDVFKRIGETEPKYQNGLIIEGVCRHFAPFSKSFCDYFNIESSIIGSKDYHVFNVVNIDGEMKIFDFTRMIGIRDGYLNPNNQQIDDWFNMSFDKMFEYKPNRIIDRIDQEKLDVFITRDNYKELINNDNESVKMSRN